MERANTTERQRRIRHLFEMASTIAPDEQTDYVLRETRDDSGLAEAVLRLLRASRAGEGFLSKPLLAPQTLSLQGVRLGAYEVVRELGQGGMGVVYLATRVDDTFKRTAALKVIRPEFNSPQMVERFRQERQILANLDHPNIARILDGGTTPSGLPYFVMDYVDGRPIDVFCNDRQASLEQRLNLFRQACDAVQYLHENRTVHRDLKPANMLVTGRGTLKLLDFGIAKVLDTNADIQIKTAPLLTPGYASPEQVTGKPTDTASDVYSLGAVLYELLTGQRPHGGEKRSVAEIIEAIGKDTVRRPSTCVGTNSALQMKESPPELRRLLRGDLDSIVMKALRREPQFRYQSVTEMAADISRHQTHRPVKARRGETLYVASRFAQRNRIAIAAVGLIAFLSLALGADEVRIYGLMQQSAAARVQIATQAANTTAKAAQRDAQIGTGLKTMSANYAKVFPQLLDDPLASRVKVSRLVQDDLQSLEQIAPMLMGKPELSTQLGWTYLALSRAQWSDTKPSLKDANSALATCQKAIDLLKQLPANYADLSAVKALESELTHQMNLLHDVRS